jgi:quinoprotein dehydrogenase-associated probable ABC transporter substrate-binding protein
VIFKAIVLGTIILLGAVGTVGLAASEGSLKVCADPANLPLSNDKGEGYENKIADAMAHDMGRKVEYVFFPQRMGFVRNTLRMRDEKTNQWKCDVIIGVPTGYELTATTRPYLHSTYALLLAPRADFAPLHTADDLLKLPPEQVAKLRIGVFSRSPGNDWLLKNSLIEHAAVYTHQNGDVQESPARTIERAMGAAQIDAAILWGPLASMLAMNHADLKWRAVPFLPQPEIRFDYSISMGLRNGEPEWQKTLDDWIAGHGPQITEILRTYHIPIVDSSGQVQM